MSMPWFLELLELPPHADERAVRRAYAVRVKLIDPATDPAGFARLREAYECARAWVADEDHEASEVFTGPARNDDMGEDVAPHQDVAHPVALTVNPQEQAVHLADQFAARVTNDPGVDIQSELEACTAELRLQYIDAPGMFEELLIDRLARGLIGRRASVFAVATDHFHWQEIGHVASLGPAGAWIEAVESQRMAWHSLSQPVRANRLALIEQADAATGALPASIVRRWFEVRDDFRHFPAWLGLFLLPARQYEWASSYDRLPSLERQALEATVTKRRLRLPNVRSIVGTWGFFILAMIGGLSHLIGAALTSERTNPSTPATASTDIPAATSVPSGVSSGLQVVLSEPADPSHQGIGWIVVTLTNHGETMLYMSRVNTPPLTIDTHLARPLFSVTDQHGFAPRFIDHVVVIDPAKPDAFFLRLEPGQTRSITFNLADDYDLLPGNRYSVRYPQAVTFSVESGGSPHNQIAYVPSNTIDVDFRRRVPESPSR